MPTQREGDVIVDDDVAVGLAAVPGEPARTRRLQLPASADQALEVLARVAVAKAGLEAFLVGIDRVPAQLDLLAADLARAAAVDDDSSDHVATVVVTGDTAPRFRSQLRGRGPDALHPVEHA